MRDENSSSSGLRVRRLMGRDETARQPTRPPYRHRFVSDAGTASCTKRCGRQAPDRGRLAVPVWFDATYLKVREAGRIVSFAVMIAVAVNTDGTREVLGMAIGPSEAEPFQTGFLRSLTRRGLRGVKLVISDAHLGIKAAVAKVLKSTPPRAFSAHSARARRQRTATAGARADQHRDCSRRNLAAGSSSLPGTNNSLFFKGERAQRQGDDPPPPLPSPTGLPSLSLRSMRPRTFASNATTHLRNRPSAPRLSPITCNGVSRSPDRFDPKRECDAPKRDRFQL